MPVDVLPTTERRKRNESIVAMIHELSCGAGARTRTEMHGNNPCIDMLEGASAVGIEDTKEPDLATTSPAAVPLHRCKQILS